MSAQPNCYREPSYPRLLRQLELSEDRARWTGPRPRAVGRIRPLSFSDFPDFRPNLTPWQMFALGIFGGSYWRPIRSGVLRRVLTHQHEEFNWEGIPTEWLCSPYCRPGINYFGAYSGTSQQYWESKGWIKAQDPYGWVQWYCRFSAGRRSPDDARQVERWMRFAGPRGRFRLQHLRLAEEGRFSPAVAQALLQWGFLVRPQ